MFEDDNVMGTTISKFDAWYEAAPEGSSGLGGPSLVESYLKCDYVAILENNQVDMSMSLRMRLSDSLKEAMKAKAVDRLPTLRLISAAIKDKDIDARAGGAEDGVSDSDLLAILSKMVKQRLESAKAYEEGGRLELAEKERAEILIIEEFLPKQLTEDETKAAIEAAIADTGATSLRDMGKVMGVLKDKYTGQLDFGKVGGVVKSILG